MVVDVTDLYREFGAERLPPGQREAADFPVLSKSGTPPVDSDDWRFEAWGAVADPLAFDRAGVFGDAVHVLFHAADGYTTDLPLDACDRRDDAVRVGTERGTAGPRPRRAGARRHAPPVRVQGTKWVTGVEFLTEPERGFWERRGYSVTADPWAEERYS